MFFISKTRSLVLSIGFILLGIGVLIYSTLISLNMRKAPVDLYNTDWEQLHMYQHVECDLDFLMDYYMYYERDGKTSSRAYVVPDLLADSENGVYAAHYMGIMVSSGNFGTYEKLSDESYNWWMDETNTVEYPVDVIPVDGYLRKMSANDKKYMTEFLQEQGYTDEEIKQVITPYVIMTNGDSQTGIMIAGVILIVFGGVILALTIFRMRNNR